jgi:hypothetical protein
VKRYFKRLWLALLGKTISPYYDCNSEYGSGSTERNTYDPYKDWDGIGGGSGSINFSPGVRVSDDGTRISDIAKETNILNVDVDSLPSVTNKKKLNVNSWDEISDLVGKDGYTLTGPFQIGKKQ